MTWRLQRQLTIVFVILVFLAVVFGLFYFYTRPAPSCFDRAQNQGEQGVDCGGSCVKICQDQAIPLITLWTRPFEISPGVYSAVAFVENPNRSLGIPYLAYEFSLVDKAGRVITRGTGHTFANPSERFPIFLGGLSDPSRSVKSAFVTFTDPIEWRRTEREVPKVSVRQTGLELLPVPRLSAEVESSSIVELSNLPVVAVISGPGGNAFTGSATLVDRLPSGGQQQVYFTWPLPFEIEPTLFDLYPRVNVFELPEVQ